MWRDLRREATRAICDAATPGPWFAEPIGDRDQHAIQHGRTIQGVLRWQGYLNSLDCGEDDGTATFIAHARTALPAALDEIERLRTDQTTPGQTYCWVQGPALTACDRKGGHLGAHSWEPSAEGGAS